MSLNRKKRLLVLSTSMGWGHISVSESLCSNYRKKYGGEAIHVDFLNYLNPWLSKLVISLYFLVSKHAPVLNKLLYDGSNKKTGKVFKKIVSFLILKRYRKLINEYNPDLILSTHSVAAMAVSLMYKNFPIPNGVVVTDLDFSFMWMHENNNKIFIGCEDMIKNIKFSCFEREKICVSGIPVRDQFLKKFNKKMLKKKLDLEINVPVFLLMSGGKAVVSFEKILKSLIKVLKNFQVVIITGNNRKMYLDLKIKFKEFNLKGKVLGFVENIEEYMAITDLLISKPGGLTTTESLVMGLPILMFGSTLGWEEGNIKFLEKEKVGIYIKNVENINKIINRLLKNPKEVRRMSDRAKYLSKPKATQIIIDEMMLLVS